MKIVTHNGRFHHDDILATVILRKLYPQAEIIRTRTDSLIASGDIVYDVGSVYDPINLRFDHHQADFSETFSEKYKYKMSSAGLIYRHFAEEFISKYGFDTSTTLLPQVIEEIYQDYFLGVDAIDNGYNTNSSYYIRSLSNLVSNFNAVETTDDELQYTRFLECMTVIEIDLDNFMKKVLFSRFPMQEIAIKLLKETVGDVIVSDSYVEPGYLVTVENEYNRDIKFLVHVINDGDIRVKAMPVGVGSFDLKIQLKKEWCGRRGAELELVSGIEGITFVHANGFIGGCKTVEGALEMCNLSIKSSEDVV